MQNQEDPQRAKELIRQAEQQQLSDLLLAALPGVKGLVALNEGKNQEAVTLINQSNERWKKWAGMPAIGSVMDSNHGYLAIAYANLRDVARSAEHWRKAEPRLRAIQSRILDQYAAASRQLAGLTPA
jgi:hypothetical protein